MFVLVNYYDVSDYDIGDDTQQVVVEDDDSTDTDNNSYKTTSNTATNDILDNPLSGYSQLSDEEKEAYLRITNELDDLNANFSISDLGLNEEQFERVTNYILSDHPEYFYVDHLSYTMGLNNKILDVNYTFSLDEDEILEKQQEVEKWSDAILSNVTDDMSDYEVAKYLHDYIVSNVDYDLTVDNDQNILSVVEENRSVCAGYTRAYQYLLNEAGIFSTYVTGNVASGPHAWNLVELDGEYGWIDVTWDDPSFGDSSIPDEYISHTYFGLSTEDIQKSHALDSSYNYIEEISEPSYNYFSKEELLVDVNDKASYQEFLDTVDENIKKGENIVEVKAVDETQINDLLNDVSNNYMFSSFSYIPDQYYPIITFMFN